MIMHHTIHANNIRQHYMEAGEGVPVVLLHGFPETSYAWRHQIPELAKKFRVIAPDLRGYGETDKPATGYDKRNMGKYPPAEPGALGSEPLKAAVRGR